MHKIIGTSKIRGTLSLANLGLEIAPGESRVINDKQRQSHEIQEAYRAKYIEFILSDAMSRGPDDCYICVNKHNRPLSLPGRKGEITPGKQFTLSTAEFYSTEIQQARSGGLIEVLKQTGSSAKAVKEGVVDVGRFVKESDSNDEKETKKTRETKEDEDKQESQKENKNKSKGESKEAVLDINEELGDLTVSKESNKKSKKKTTKKSSKKTTKKKKTKKSKASSKQTDKSASRTEKKHMKTSYVDTENPDPVDATEGDPRSCSVAWTPGKKNSGVIDLRNMMGDDEDEAIPVGHQGDAINFVDKEQEEKRIKDDPRLRNNEGKETSDSES